MTDSIKAALLAEYAPRCAEVLPLAIRAFGSRDTISPQHDASREYTRLLCEFYQKGGSLLDMAKELDVTYAGLNRRVTTKNVPASSGRPRKEFTRETYELAVDDIESAKGISTEAYHATIKKWYDAGLSLTRIGKAMGLSGGSPLYYAVSRASAKESAETSKN